MREFITFQPYYICITHQQWKTQYIIDEQYEFRNGISFYTLNWSRKIQGHRDSSCSNLIQTIYIVIDTSCRWYLCTICHTSSFVAKYILHKTLAVSFKFIRTRLKCSRNTYVRETTVVYIIYKAQISTQYAYFFPIILANAHQVHNYYFM